MTSSMPYWTTMDMYHMIGLSCVSIVVYVYLIRDIFKNNIILFFNRLFKIKDKPILYSYRHICVLLCSYFLVVASLLSLNIFYLILQIYAYNKLPINTVLVNYSELNIKIMATICATVNIVSIMLYYIRNNNNFMKKLKNNYCLLESLLSIILCVIYVTAVKNARPMGIVKGDVSNFFIVIIISFLLVDFLIQRLQIKTKLSIRKALFGNSKIREAVNISKTEDIVLLYNVLMCDGLTIVLLLYSYTLNAFTISKALAYALLPLIFINITKRYKNAIENITQIKEKK